MRLSVQDLDFARFAVWGLRGLGISGCAWGLRSWACLEVRLFDPVCVLFPPGSLSRFGMLSLLLSGVPSRAHRATSLTDEGAATLFEEQPKTYHLPGDRP